MCGRYSTNSSSDKEEKPHEWGRSVNFSTLGSIKHLSYRYCHCTKSRGESEWWKVRGYVSSPGHLNDMTTLWVVSSSPFYNWGSWDTEWPMDLQGISPQVTKPRLKPSNYDSRFCCLPLSRVAHESEVLGELLAYLLYTFLMNRPLGLIKGKKD